MYNTIKHIIAQLINSILSHRILVAVLINVSLMAQMIIEVRNFSENVCIRVSPWIFPFLLQQSYIQLIFVLGAVLLFCDAPFIKGISIYELLRCGKIRWVINKVLYIFSLSFLYVMLIVISTILLFGRRMDLSFSWGKVITSLAASGTTDGIGGYISLDYNLVLTYTPVQAMLLSVILAFVISVLVGLCIFAINLNTKLLHGEIIGGLIGVLPYFQSNFSNLYTMYYFSPASWLNIVLWKVDIKLMFPSTTYMCSFLIILFAVLFIGLVIGILRKDDLCEEVKAIWKQ